MSFLRALIIPLLVLLTILDLVFFRVLTKLFKFGIVGYVLIFLFVIEFYSFQAFRVLTKSKIAIAVYILLTVALYGSLVYYQATASWGFAAPQYKKIFILITLFITPKIFLALGMCLEDLIRILEYSFNGKEHKSIPGRRRTIAMIAWGVAALPFLGILDGIIFGRYRFRVVRQKVRIKDLPDEFEGFTITQISDVHSGSFDDIEKVDYGVKMARDQNSDVLVFTGDMVNNHYSEMEPYTDIFSQLEAKEGMFATLGNHDYGEYGDLTAKERVESREKLQQMQRDMGFTVLNNEMQTIIRNGKRLNIIGVENWGSSEYFPKKGDLKKATKNVQNGDINILLSHDPSHFDHDLPGYDNIINFEKFMHLTLSGHTHGMQFGIEIPGLIKWSPVKYRYHHWAGLYETKGRQHYVNRGFGYLAFPGRVGEWPEITVIELTKA